MKQKITINIAKTIITLLFILSSTFLTAAQNSSVGNSSPAVQSQTSEREGQNNPANTVQNGAANTNCADAATAGVIILVADTSPSVRNQLAAIKSRGKEILALAPQCVRFGVVSINWEAIKKTFPYKAEADKFIDSLKVGGQYTDLNRGNDATLSLLPTTGKSVVVFMTDGKATVPADFKNKESFIEILRREYGARPDVRVFVLNVNGKPLAEGETLPANVSVIPISDWQTARSVIAETLAPQIKQQFTPEKTPDTVVSPEEVKKPVEAEKKINLLYLSAVALAALAAIFVVWRKKRNRFQTSEEILLSDQPENILRDEDLEQTPLQIPAPEAVLMIEAVDINEEQFSASPLRSFVNLDERLTIGGARLLSGMFLPDLSQSQTLEISFDGKVAGVIRLRPNDGETLDAVLLNGQIAPKSFVLVPDEPNHLSVGNYELRLTATDASMVEIFDTSKRTAPATLAESHKSAQTEPGSVRRRVRSGL